jgi:GGDEF domain-containing protein
MSPDVLIAQADTAMYAAKRSGGGTYALFTDFQG